MTALQADYFERPLAEVDPEVAEAIGHELARQQHTLEMIASGEVPVLDLITHRLPLDRVHDAIDTVAKGAAIKVTIEP